MNEFGTRNPANGIDSIGFTETGAVHYNLTEAALCEQAIGRREATFRLPAPHLRRAVPLPCETP